MYQAQEDPNSSKSVPKLIGLGSFQQNNDFCRRKHNIPSSKMSGVIKLSSVWGTIFDNLINEKKKPANI